jgi:hypothetical protein
MVWNAGLNRQHQRISQRKCSSKFVYQRSKVPGIGLLWIVVMICCCGRIIMGQMTHILKSKSKSPSTGDSTSKN